MKTKTQIVSLWIILTLLAHLVEANVTKQTEYRSLTQEDGNSSQLELIMDKSISMLSTVINLLKRVLVLATLLFLIQNLINFWVLASSYAFLNIDTPEYLKATISKIYNLYNESIFSYLGFSIDYPELKITNQTADMTQMESLYEFHFFQFALEPSILLVLTLIELSIAKVIVKRIKASARKHQEQYLQESIEQKLLQEKIDQIPRKKGKENHTNKLSSQEPQSSFFGSFFKSNKIANENENADPENISHPQKTQNFLSQIAYKVIAQQMRKQILSKSPRHWSEDVNINKMQKISAILINYIPGLLIPAYTLIFNNKITTFSEKIALLTYYFLLCGVILFPFLYISGITKKKNKKKGNLLKPSDIETLSQYALNICMSVTLGIRNTPVPFMLTSFLILSAILIYSFMEGNSNKSCGTSWSKVNKIIHKMTFWLYHLTFVVLYALTLLKSNSTSQTIDFQLYAYYCSIGCLWLFIIGGCHQLFEFAITSVSFVFKMIFLIFEACTKEQVEKEDPKDEISDVPKESLQLNNDEIPNQPKKSPKEEENIFQNMNQEQLSQNQVIEVLAHQIVVHERLLENMTNLQL